jgi:serine/threonine-protein kinase
MERPDQLSSIDRYTIERLLGTGAMGRVYLAYDTKLHRRVALKVLGSTSDGIVGEATEVALREARAAAAIAHPNAAAIYDAGLSGDLAFIVMEYVPGVSLRALIGDANVLLSARLRWLVEIASALTAAHAAGVVHRDVKPDNVLVREDGILKVLDFGIARVPHREDEAAAFATWTEGSTFMGTPAYMAPEALRGGEVDGRADQFGWGVLAYELISGRLPWKRSDTPFGAIASVLTETPEPLGGDVPPEVSAAIARAMSKSPADRFASLTEAAAALAPFAGRATPLYLPPPDSSVRSAPISRSPRASSSFPPQTPSPVPAAPLSSPSSMPPSAPLTRRSPQASIPPAPRPVLRVAPPSPPSLRAPNFQAPVDLDAHLALLPPNAVCKGMFFVDLLRAAARVATPVELAMRARIPDRRYVPFRDYPMADNMRLTYAVARTILPGLPVGEALRRLGHRALDVILESHIGRTLFSALGSDPEPFILQGPRAYRLLIPVGEMTSEKIGPGEFRVRVRDMPLFLETYQVGVLESILRRCRASAEVRVALDSLASGTFAIHID